MKIKKNWLKAILIQHIICLIMIYLCHTEVFSDIIIGLICILGMIPGLLLTIKENKLFSPIIPSFIFDLSFYFYLMMLVTSYEYMKIESMVIITFCSFIWKFMIIKSSGFLKSTKKEEIKITKINSLYFTFIVTTLFIISLLSMAFEWIMAGGIPALRSDSEFFRFTVSYSPIIHLLAIMNKIVAVLIGAYLINKDYLSLRKKYFLCLLIVVSELQMLGTSMRGEIIMAPCIIFIVYAIKKKIKIKYYVISAVIALAFIGFMPYYRMLNAHGVSYVSSLKSISSYPYLYMLTPLYQSFTNNFSILNLDFNIFPDTMPFGYGSYSILPGIPFLHLGKSLMDVQNQVLNNNFYAGLTATYLAVWYADFGYLGCIISTIIFAKITIFAYNKFLSDNSLFSLVWYAYVFYSSLWMFYNSTFDIVFICYSLIIWAVLNTNVKYQVL